jgi:GTPase
MENVKKTEKIETAEVAETEKIETAEEVEILEVAAEIEKIKAETEVRKIPTVAIVGRPNVGKSSLFNALIRKRVSIVHEMCGVTRDRVVAPASWNGKHFQLMDTGGLGTMTGKTRNVDQWDERIGEQVEVALEGADILILVCNVQDGIVALDQEVAKRLHTYGSRVIVVANKSDNPKLKAASEEFSKLGFKELIPVSSLHRINIESLLDQLVEDFDELAMPTDDRDIFRIAVVGRPNVGKSSLINALLGDERVIVSDVAGTTRDSVDIDFELEHKGEKLPASLIDTAGFRKRAKVRNVVEYFSIMRAKDAIERSRLVLFLVEASPMGTTAQDRKIASMVEESGKGCVLVINKYDTQRDEHKKEDLLKEIRYSTPGMKYAPAVFISAKEKYNLNGLLDQAAEVMEQMELRISTSMVNRVLNDAFERLSPPVIGTSPLKFYYAAMVANEPPNFLMFVNNPKYCADNYLAYLKKCLRKAFGFTGLPIIIMLRARPKKVVSFHTEGRSANGKATSKSSVVKFIRKKKKEDRKQEKNKDRRQNNRPRRGTDRNVPKKQSRGKKR